MDIKQEAIKCFNQTWDLMDLAERTDEQNAEMLHKAHASCYLWKQVGTPLNFARGEWQISRVYSVLKMAEPALLHARVSFKIIQDNSIGDFDLAFAYEAFARAYSVAGDAEKTEEYRTLGLKAAESIEKKEDKTYTISELENIKIIAQPK